MRVLLIEDEAPLREQITAHLRAQGYAVDAAPNGNDGCFMGTEYPVDVAIVDIGLPDITGVEVIRRWRKADRRFPVLILTARSRWQDKVEGLEIGADDYLVKPFEFEELTARLRALVRRAAGWTESALTCGPLVLNTGAQQLRVNGASVELTAFEYKIIEYLMLHAGEVVSKTTLAEHVYEEDTDRDSNVLEVIIGRLRKKIDPDKSLNPIETLRGRGYLLRLPRS
ncbi:MAG TPA: response regulator transcription factor [Gammaproteobacteria bacterium]|nr:response regulator transcription factor [Gammaproteobacteria bacterium]